MLKSASQRSFQSASDGEQSLFQRHLPAAAEELAVDIPVGRATRLKTQRARSRRYVLKVHPGARHENSLWSLPQVVSARGPATERDAFRIERAGKFQLGRRFPALVAAPELLPSWSSARGCGESPRSARVGTGEVAPAPQAGINRTTESIARKQRSKLLEVGQKGFIGTVAKGPSLICDRGPALFADPYEDALEAEKKATFEAKERLRGEANFITRGMASARQSTDPSRPAMDDHIATMRERGRVLNESLRERYEQRLQAFRLNQKVGRSTFSFERSQREEALRQAEEAAEAKRREEIARQEAEQATKKTTAIGLDLQLNIGR